MNENTARRVRLVGPLFRWLACAFCLVSGAPVLALDTSPAAKITEIDVYSLPPENGGAYAIIRLDPTITVSNPFNCSLFSNWFAISLANDGDRAFFAQVQLAYVLKRTVIMHVGTCTGGGGSGYPVIHGMKTL